MIFFKRCFIYILCIKCILIIFFLIYNCKYENLKSLSKINNNYENNLIIFYNRIPKTGSTTVANLFYSLCKENHFHSIFINITRNSHILTLLNQQKIVKNISLWNSKKPIIYHGHLAYIDFSQFGYQNPIYINFIRRPLERLVSYYYFLRFGDDFRPFLIRSRMKDKKIQQQTFDSCVSEKGNDCRTKNLWLQIPFFCGQAPYCWEEGNIEALATAKRRVVEQYAFVGIAEDLRGGLEVLNELFPQFFKGILNLYDLGGKLSLMRKTKNKKPLLPQTIEIIQQSNTWKMEQEFYDFVKDNYVKNVNFIRSKKAQNQVFNYRRIRP